MERVCREADGLFPAPSEIKMSCSCPDWADMCKHVAATLYGVGARLDSDPDLLFALRGVDRAELVSNVGADLPLTRTACGERPRARRRRRRGAVRHRHRRAGRAAPEAEPRGKRVGACSSRSGAASSKEAGAGEDQGRSRSGDGASRSAPVERLGEGGDWRRRGGAGQASEIGDRRQAEGGKRPRTAGAAREEAAPARPAALGEGSAASPKPGKPPSAPVPPVLRRARRDFRSVDARPGQRRSPCFSLVTGRNSEDPRASRSLPARKRAVFSGV